MQENEKKKEDASWDSVEKCLASEIINSAKKESKAKDIGIVCTTIIASIAIIGLLLVNQNQTNSFLNYLSEYDFVSQDGEGFNYFNTDIGGDVSNGTESPETEE